MAASQRDISVSEFFAKNRHLLGFDNPRKALLTTVKEAVDNAVDAAEETSGGVLVSWRTENGSVEVVVEDEGHGVPDTSNLFVPFYTTKDKGSGIGLALCLQIAEGHGGTITLENREDRSGCRARLRLPVKGPEKAKTA